MSVALHKVYDTVHRAVINRYTHSLLLLSKQTQVGIPEATASLLRSPQGGECIY
jgi:hypothetical protein